MGWGEGGGVEVTYGIHLRPVMIFRKAAVCLYCLGVLKKTEAIEKSFVLFCDPLSQTEVKLSSNRISWCNDWVVFAVCEAQPVYAGPPWSINIAGVNIRKRNSQGVLYCLLTSYNLSLPVQHRPSTTFFYALSPNSTLGYGDDDDDDDDNGGNSGGNGHDDDDDVSLFLLYLFLYLSPCFLQLCSARGLLWGFSSFIFLSGFRSLSDVYSLSISAR